MVKLTGYGGVGEIGGNAFLIDDGKSRVFLDFGKRFGGANAREDFQHRPGWGDYYDLLMRPRGGHQVHDLIMMDLLPPLPSIYRTDMGGLPAKSTDAGKIDLVVVSHPHSDHYGLMGYLKPETPAFMSSITKLTIESVQKTGTAAPDESLVRFKPADQELPRTSKDRTAEEALAAMPERAIETGDTTDVGQWTINRFDVDHSIHGASGFILEPKGDAPRIAYSGDLRLHGRHKERSERFLKAAEEANVLMIEGTRVGSAHRHDPSLYRPTTEVEVGKAIEEVLTSPAMGKSKGFAAIAYPPRDMDRLISVTQAARKTNRKLVITDKQAHLLWGLHGAGHVEEVMDPVKSGDLVVLVSESVRAKQEAEKATRESGQSAWSVWTRDVTDLDAALHKADRTVTTQEIANDPRGYLVTMGSFTLNLLPGLLEPGKGNGAFIHSQTQPFNDEGIIKDYRLQRWLQWFGLADVDTHVSGHISRDDLLHILDESHAKTLVPIHTDNAYLSGAHYQAAHPSGRVKLPWPGVPIDL